jgi:hypothetical protein
VILSGTAVFALEQKLAAAGALRRTERLDRAVEGLKAEQEFVLVDCPQECGPAEVQRASSGAGSDRSTRDELLRSAGRIQ